jgi:uncharacterized protein with GYD domain
MPTFICSLSWTDKGLRSIDEAPKRRMLARGVAGRMGITLKDFYITSGDCDVLITMDAPDGDVVAKFALIVASQGNVYARTARAFPESEFDALMTTVSELRVI